MKKARSVFLAALLLLSLTACGGNSDTNNEESISALEDDAYLNTLVEEIYPSGPPDGEGIAVYGLELAKAENEAKFEQNYIGNTYQISGIVFQIESDCFILGYTEFNGAGDLGAIGANGGIRGYLESEDLANLQVLSSITVTGTLEDAGEYSCTALLENAVLVA